MDLQSLVWFGEFKMATGPFGGFLLDANAF